MVHWPYLQPFADINKRTSRLAANLPLFRAKLCPLTRDDVQALVMQELRRLHEGVLARYGLRPSELAAWQAAQRSL